MIKYAIFDADGTLFYSMHVWENLLNTYLEGFGIVPEESINNAVSGMSVKECSQFLVDKYSLNISADEVNNSLFECLENFYFNQVEIKNGVFEFLNYLKENNVKMCIATSSAKYLIEAATKKNGIYDFFDFIITSNEVGVGKYRPDIYLAALERLGGEIEFTCVFEDNVQAALTAKSAGFKVCGVYDDFQGCFPVDSVDAFVKSFGNAELTL